MPTNRIAIKSVLTSARYGCALAADAATAVATARQEQVDLILWDLGLGVEALQTLKAHPDTCDIPVIVLGAAPSRQQRIEALQAGAEDILAKPASPAKLLARIRSALRARDTSSALAERQSTVRDLGFAEAAPSFAGPCRIVLVANEAARAVVWSAALRPLMRAEIGALTHDMALSETERETAADLFVIEARPGQPAEALRLLAELRARAATRHSGIVIVHEPEDGDTAAMALDLGANDLCELGFEPAELALRLKIQLRRKREGDRLRASVEEGLRLAVIDPLTGLFNRRYALTHAARLLNDEAALSGFCVMLADIDRFKAVNDTYGHAVGDQVLVEVAHRLRDNMRGMDMVARIGGEEFLMVLPETEPQAALAAARRICAIVRDTPVSLGRGRPELPVTVSVGVAMAQQGETVEAVIERADVALYRAKEAGRDRVDAADIRAA